MRDTGQRSLDQSSPKKRAAIRHGTIRQWADIDMAKVTSSGADIDMAKITIGAGIDMAKVTNGGPDIDMAKVASWADIDMAKGWHMVVPNPSAVSPRRDFSFPPASSA